MKKYLMMGLAALALASCSNDDVYNASRDRVHDTYDAAFLKYVGGSIAGNQDWGFGSNAGARHMNFTRSLAAPVVAEIDAPYDEAWVAEYLNTAKEPDATNTTDNYDNTSYAINYGTGGPNDIDWNNAKQVEEKDYFFSLSWEEQIAYALAKHPTWLTYNVDETFVRNFKITGTYDGNINVAATEGYTEGVANGNERTVVVTGTWNITEDQRIGSLGKIIIADGGVVNVAEGKQLNMVNQARLVVLPGGKLTGAGKVEVNNGNAAGEENYNGGIVDVASFNNNFGKFYNYGQFLVNEYIGGAQESNFYNHALAAIDHFSSTANARIFNGCQFYVKNDARLRNYEGVQGSALIVGGQLLFSGSEDGTTTPTYVSLEAGALVQAGSLYNNGTSWVGPTENGYAVLSIGQFDYMNWVQDYPEQGGYFANNIYLVADVLDNVPDGNGMQQKEDNGTEYYTMSKADWKFKNVVGNAVGNGNVTIAEKGDYEVIPADADFELGKAGCTPGFKIKTTTPVLTPDIRIIAEDLSATEESDFDFNDVVFDVTFTSATTATITLQAAGGTLPLRFMENNDLEVHKLFKVSSKTMVNTSASSYATDGYAYADGKEPVTFDVTGIDRNKNGKDIKIEVQKDGVWYEITAEQGQPAAKIGVDPKFQWVNEKVSLKSVYDQFGSYVTNPSLKWY